MKTSFITRLLLWVSIFAFSLSSCRKEDEIIPSTEEQGGKPEPAGPIKGFFLLNEANMGSNKSTLDYYDYETGKYTHNIYAERNPGVVRSMATASMPSSTSPTSSRSWT